MNEDLLQDLIKAVSDLGGTIEPIPEPEETTSGDEDQ